MQAGKQDTSEAEVVELPKPAGVQLTSEERLRLENVQLKMELAKRQFGALMQQLNAEQEQVAKGVAERTGADLREYDVDLASGACRRRESSDGRKV